ncbi:MAG TPA: sodium:phosphate symporter [Natronoarchaeum rubrum]|nr:sodium:phosphate symporter [Natronoarchaeum rubrum]
MLALQVSVTIVLFLFAIRLLGSSTDALTPFLRRVLGRIVVGDWSALGLGWFASYVLANGSIVAALSLSLFKSELLLPSQLFLMIVGSRLGGAAVVVFVGAFDYLNEELDTVRESTSLGLLTFLVTHSIYLPALALGYLWLPAIESVEGQTRLLPESDAAVRDVVSIGAEAIVELVGAGMAFVLAIGLIFLSLRLFDRVLDSVDKRQLRQRYVSKLNDKWVSFGLGLVVTGLTTSVAFSLGIVVPLYNRGHVKRDEIVPFVLGANVGTLVDTLIVAIALDTAVGALTVVVLLVVGFVLSVSVLVFYETYGRIVAAAQRELVGSTWYFVGFLLSLLLVPLLLVAV